MEDKIKSIKKILGFDAILAIIVLSVLITITFLGVIMRYCFSNPFSWIEEVQLLCFVWLTFLGGCTAYRTYSHVAIDIIIDAFPKKIKQIAEFIIYIIVVLVLLYMLKQGTTLVIQMFNSGRKTNILYIPYYIIYGIFPVGCLFMLINTTVATLENWIKYKKELDEEVK